MDSECGKFFSDNLTSLMREFGKESEPLSKSELARAMNLSPSAVNKWEKGSIPAGPILDKLARFFGVTVGQLLSENLALPKTPSDPVGTAIRLLKQYKRDEKKKNAS